MALYRYTGEPGRVWPDVPTTPDVGDVVDWRDLTPDPTSWAPAPKAKVVRPADNDDAPELDPEPAPIDPPLVADQES